MLTHDPKYLANEQYRDGSNLRARGQLHARFSTNPQGWFRWYFDRLELPQNARILELGCGQGWLWRENRERIPAGWEITLTDFSPGMLDEAAANLSSLARPFRFECADAQEIPFEDGSCDAVLANHMLYHVPDRQRALSEIRRVLKPRGRLYAATNGEKHLREMAELVYAVLPDLDREDAFVFAHASEFTLENGAAQLAPHFSDVRLVPFEDALRVTEAEPLLAHLLSGPVSKALNAEQVERLRASIASQIAGQGFIHVTKAVGLFKAERH